MKVQYSSLCRHCNSVSSVVLVHSGAFWQFVCKQPDCGYSRPVTGSELAQIFPVSKEGKETALGGATFQHQAIAKDKVEAMSQTEGLSKARGHQYGPMEELASFVQKWKNECRKKPGWYGLGATEREAVDNIVLKLGRILNGAQLQTDSWLDISGYAKLAADYITLVLENKAKRPAAHDLGQEKSHGLDPS